LNAALAANPIGLVVVAIAALVAALVIAYRESETFRNIVNGAFKAVSIAFGWILGAAKDVFGWLTDHWPLVLAIITGPIGMAIMLIKSLVPKMIEVAKNLLEGFIGGLKSVASAVVSAGGWIVMKVIEGVHAVASAIASTGGWIIDRVASGLKAAVGFAADVGGWIKNRIVEGLHAYTDAISEIGGWLINKIVAGLKSVAGIGAEVGGWIKDKVVNGISGLAESFVNIGGDIIRGIAKGIRDKAGDVIDAIKDAVTNKLPGFVKKALGIKSPSRVFMEIGRNISLGMAQGITSEAGQVQRAMTDLSAVPAVSQGTIGALGYVQPPVAAPVSMPAMSTAAAIGGSERAGVTIMGDLVVQDPSDADTIASRLAWLMENG
jgi:phage-related protein